LAFTYNDRIHLYTTLVKDFNNYAKNNDLDINLNLTILTPLNSTIYLNNYNSMIESLMQRQSTKYDIFFYYATYSIEFGEYFINLKDYLDEEHIEYYDSNTLSSICQYEDKIAGLVIFNLNIILNKFFKYFFSSKSFIILDNNYISINK